MRGIAQVILGNQVESVTLWLPSRSPFSGLLNLENIRKDFERFGFTLDLASADPMHNPSRLAELAKLNKFRNIAAHHGNVPAGGMPDLPTVQGWRSSCEGLATSLDGVMYNALLGLLTKRPWKP